MVTRTLVSVFIVAMATAFLGCSETLRVPVPSTDTTGTAGAAGTSSPAPDASTSTAATGGGLVSGGSGAAGASSVGAGGTTAFGSGAGGQAGHAPNAGTGATGGMAAMGTGGMTGPGGTVPTFPSAPWVIEGTGKYVDLKHRPIGMSRDGHRVLDSSGMLWDDGTPIPTLTAAPVPLPVALSADGTTVVGDVGSPPCPTATTWSRAAATLWPAPVQVVATSADGATTVGTWPFACMTRMRAFVLSLGAFVLGGQGTPIDPLLGDDATEALAVSADGSTVFAFSSTRADDMGWLISFKQGSSMQMHVPKIHRPGFGVLTSANGLVVVGTLTDGGGADTAFMWGSQGPMVAGVLDPLPLPATRKQSLAFGISADGKVALALGTNAPSGPPVPAAKDGLPYLWSAAKGLEVLALPASVMGLETVVMAEDASLIVGNPTPNTGAPALVWDSQRKPGFVFADAPGFVAHCHPFVTNVSVDGKTFVGSCDLGGRNTGFVARF